MIMARHWTDAELVAALRDLRIIIDTREQVNDHVTAYLDSKKIAYHTRKLDVGDYSCELNGQTFERSFAVERKANLDELCGNMTADRDRFEREFIRAKAFGTKVYLLIENASWDDVYLHNYRSKLSEKSLLATLLAWQTRFNVTVIFCDRKNAPKLIHGILYYAARDALLFGGG